MFWNSELLICCISVDFSIISLLYHFFNICIHSSCIPKIWHKTIPMPNYKNGDPSDIQNYRPISRSQNLRKLFEKTLYNSLEHILKKSNKIQFAYKKRHSVYDAVNKLLELIQDINCIQGYSEFNEYGFTHILHGKFTFIDLIQKSFPKHKN